MVIPSAIEGVRSSIVAKRGIKGREWKRRKNMDGAQQHKPHEEENTEAAGGALRTYNIYTVDRISRTGHARNLAERKHVLPWFDESLASSGEKIPVREGANCVTTKSRLSFIFREKNIALVASPAETSRKYVFATFSP